MWTAARQVWTGDKQASTLPPSGGKCDSAADCHQARTAFSLFKRSWKIWHFFWYMQFKKMVTFFFLTLKTHTVLLKQNVCGARCSPPTYCRFVTLDLSSFCCRLCSLYIGSEVCCRRAPRTTEKSVFRLPQYQHSLPLSRTFLLSF